MILSLEEKKRGSKRLKQDSGKFKTLIDHLKLVDIENSNGTFTWSNCRSGNQHIACCMDRFLVTEELMEEGAYMENLILPKSRLNHWPLAFNLDTGGTPK